MRNRTAFSVSIVVASLALAMMGCQRPFEDVGTPGIDVVEPDLSQVQLGAEILLRLEAVSSFSSITRVDLGSEPMAYDQSSETWSSPVDLEVGLNRLVVTAFAEDGNPAVDTFFAVRLPYEIDPGAVMPLAVAGHTASLTASGNVVVTGGARTNGGPAEDKIQVFIRASGQFNSVETGLLSARVGHSATVLNDGRILIVGGGTREEIAATGELVESVEVFSPESGISTAISVVGDPIRRMYHTASYRITEDGLTVDLIGGTGDVQYAPNPELGIRRDMRSFVLRNDTLYALSPAIGPFIEPMTGHSQTPLRFFSPGEAASFLVTGFSYDPQPLPISLLVDFASPFGIEVRELAARRFPATRHAAEQLGRSVVGLFGGLDASNQPTGAAEIYYAEIDRIFTLPEDPSNSLFPRFGHTATFIGSNRILVIGGFSDNAAANGRALIFSYSL